MKRNLSFGIRFPSITLFHEMYARWERLFAKMDFGIIGLHYLLILALLILSVS